MHMIFAGTAFFLACAGIIGLFTLKRWEEEHQRMVLSEFRRGADEKAVKLKAMILASSHDLEKLPPLLLAIASAIVRVLAIGFGHLAHWIGERSHALADLVSYKHRFERKETRSEFLKQVTDYPITNRNGALPREEVPAPVSVSPVVEPALPAPAQELLVEQSAAISKPRRTRLSRFGIKGRKKKRTAEIGREPVIEASEEKP